MVAKLAFFDDRKRTTILIFFTLALMTTLSPTADAKTKSRTPLAYSAKKFSSAPLKKIKSAKSAKSLEIDILKMRVEALALTNVRRVEKQVCGDEPMAPTKAVARTEKLETIAQAHADDMATKGYFDHVNLDGESQDMRASRSGYKFTTIGENIAVGGYMGPAMVTEAWMQSPGHCRNLMHPDMTEVGFGVAVVKKRIFWVQLLGKPAFSFDGSGINFTKFNPPRPVPDSVDQVIAKLPKEGPIPATLPAWTNEYLKQLNLVRAEGSSCQHGKGQVEMDPADPLRSDAAMTQVAKTQVELAAKAGTVTVPLNLAQTQKLGMTRVAVYVSAKSLQNERYPSPRSALRANLADHEVCVNLLSYETRRMGLSARVGSSPMAEGTESLALPAAANGAKSPPLGNALYWTSVYPSSQEGEE